MHQVIFYPVGNGDTSQIILENGKRLLFDFRHLRSSESGQGPEINLQETIREELKSKNRDYVDVLAFTHNDKDHIENSTEFFELHHAAKYQGNGRIKINELWVPAAMILEVATNDEQSDEFVIWRQEARYRLKEGNGIRVFSKPDRLKRWLEENGLRVESRRHLITDAGQIVPGFSLNIDGVEFFCHSPFMKHVDQGDIFRNEAALILNVRFSVGGNTFDYLAVGDSTWELISDIVAISNANLNADRLNWDLFNIPHHCSYQALSDKKGETETKPKPFVEELLLHGKEGAHLVSSSNPIEDTDAGRNQSLPPHIQAKKCYQRYLRNNRGGRFLVTMEEPNTKRPEPIVFNIGTSGITRKKSILPASAIITSNPAPRAGS